MCVEIVDYIPNFSSDKSMGHGYSKKKKNKKAKLTGKFLMKCKQW